VEVKAGDWIVFAQFSAFGSTSSHTAQVEKVTAKQVRVTHTYSRSRIIRPDEVVAVFANERDAAEMKQRIDGAIGQYMQARGKAKKVCSDAILQAKERLDATIAQLVQTDAIEKERG
jgi:ATP-dependent exoDNAse (exonuclease V) beta subunit